MEPLNYSDVLFDLGRRIAELRVARGMTQAQLAERAEVTNKYIQRVEAGQENLTVKSLARFADLLSLNIAGLFEPPTSREKKVGRPRQKD